MKTEIILWVINSDGIVTKAYNHHTKTIRLDQRVESYMQSVVIKKTLASISLEYRRGEDMMRERQDAINQ